MFLRRLAEALREQNWFTVALEIVIVVVGIFIGLQVNDWNQARMDRELELLYLKRIQADLQNDLHRLDSSEYFARLRMGQVRLLLDGITNPELAASQPSSFLEAVEKASWESYRPIMPNAYAELIRTGKVTLIRSVYLRDLLAEYYGQAEFWETVLKRSSLLREYSIASAGVLDIEFLAAIEKSGPPMEPPDLGVDGKEAVSIAEKLKTREKATQLLPMIYKNHYTVIVAIMDLREPNEALQKEIEEYLNGGKGSL